MKLAFVPKTKSDPALFLEKRIDCLGIAAVHFFLGTGSGYQVVVNKETVHVKSALNQHFEIKVNVRFFFTLENPSTTAHDSRNPITSFEKGFLKTNWSHFHNLSTLRKYKSFAKQSSCF